MSRRRSNRIDFLAPVDGWSADDYILRFWEYSQGYVANQYSRFSATKNQANVSDLQGVAIESLVDFAREEYPRWVADNSADPTDARLFWSLCRRRINWDVLKWVDEQSNGDDTIPSDDPDDEDYSGAWAKTQRERDRDAHAWFLKDLLARFRTIDPSLRAVLALYYFEEMKQTDAATALGVYEVTVANRLRRAEALVLHHAVSIAARAGDPPQYKPIPRSAAFEAWVQKKYNTPADAYLEYVTACFEMDVSYLVDILRASHGDRKRRLPAGEFQSRTAKLTPEQVREIRDRLAAGEMYQPIATDYDISIDAVGAIKRGQSYQWVA